MEYRTHTLDNGLQILAEVNPRSYLSSFGVFVRTGARDEQHDISGVSHFLEHMVFKGTPNRDAEQVNRELDEMGSASNARTSEESTIYYGNVLPEFQTRMIDLLSDIMRPSLRLEDFETEKKVIIEEILMYADQPPYGGHEKVMNDYFGGHPLGQSVLGTVDTVSGLTPEAMHAYFEQRYSPGNMAIAAAGNIDFDRLIEDVERNCGSWKHFDANRPGTDAEPTFGFEQLHKPNSHQQYIIQLTPGPDNRDQRRFALRVATSILGDDSGSRLYWKFVDSGLAESAGMGAYEYADNGLVMTFLCCSPDVAQDNLKRLDEVKRSTSVEPISQKELDLAKRKIASHIVLASERTMTRMFSVGSQWLTGLDYKTPAEIAELYESITLDDVIQSLHDFPMTQSMTLVVGPRDDLVSAEA
ncbi:MAG: pitrilysin family protein [Planctomycetota bacterium]